MALCILAFLLLNRALKQTNWYKNIFIYTKQMCSNLGYRKYLIRNLEVVNLGSNPARFAFHYDGILGENWSTGNQGLDMDFEILKFRHSFIKEGGFVLVPLVAFSSISGYLINKPQYTGIKYYAKFASTLDPGQVRSIPMLNRALRFINYPLLDEPKAIRYILFDELPDNRLTISNMELMYPQLIEDARKTVEYWLSEFNMKSLDEPLRKELIDGMEISVMNLRNMIDFLVERNLQPVLVLTPMSEPLQDYFTDSVKKNLIYDFLDKVERPNIKFLDYSNNKELQNPDLYFNSLYMNLVGRKKFTKQVLRDIGLEM